MSEAVLACELARTLNVLQDTYSALRRKEAELETLQTAHAEELKLKQCEIDALNARLLLNQIMQYVKPEADVKPISDAKPTSDDYQP